MAISMGTGRTIGSFFSPHSLPRAPGRRIGGAVLVAANLAEQYQTLRVPPGASEKEVKKAFRRLALQYHPDVCKGSNCGVQFHRINEAYDSIISNLRATECEVQRQEAWRSRQNHVNDSELWEEWMGWEAAGAGDYSSPMNPYI